MMYCLAYGIVTFCDIVTHPIYTAHCRFILQSRMPNFAAYKSIIYFITKHRRHSKEIMQVLVQHSMPLMVLGLERSYPKKLPLVDWFTTNAGGRRNHWFPVG
jgi:hypothetical protein